MIAEIPGIGLLSAPALVATLAGARMFKSGREFAAFVGLVPRQRGTGSNIRPGPVAKRGAPHLRTLVSHGARALMFSVKDKGTWDEPLLRRPARNAVAATLANKMARTAWVSLVQDSTASRAMGGLRGYGNRVIRRIRKRRNSSS